MENLQPHSILAIDSTQNGMWIAVVIGWKPDLDRFHKHICENLGVSFVHMIRIDQKQVALSTLANASNSIWLYCLKADMPIHLEMLKKRAKRRPKGTLWEHLNFCSGAQIKKAIQSALAFFNKNFGELTIEADLDTERIMKAIGGKVSRPQAAHQIADMVAWFNQANNPPKNVREIDISQQVLAMLKNRLKI